MISVHLPQVLHETRGVWNKAQAHLLAQRATRQAEQQQWEGAAALLLSLAKLSTEQTLSAGAWRELLGAQVRLLMRAKTDSARDLLAEVVEQYLWLAWSGQHEHSMPWSLIDAFEIAQREQQWRIGAAFGDLLARQYPTFPYGPYAAAHFREAARLQDGELEPSLMRANAKRFELAQQLAQQLNRPQLAQHCQLRRGVALMLSGTERAQGRAALKAIKPELLGAQERIWYMWGMSKSDFWLDRVRAADILDDLTVAIQQHRPEIAQLGLEPKLPERMLNLLLWREGLELHPSEEDRLRSLLGLVYKGDEHARRVSALNVRVELQELKRVPAHSAEADQLERTLEQSAQALGASWRRASSSVRFLRQLSDPDFTPGPDHAIPREAPEPALLGSQAALELLLAAKRRDLGAVEQGLQKLRQQLTQDPELLQHPERLAPLGAAWPTLLKLTATPDEAADERAQEQLSYIKELLMHTIARWAQRAPRPGYGWWPLAAHLVDQQLWDGAKALARRGSASTLASCPPEELQARSFVIGKILAQVIEGADRLEMLQWLELADQLD